jgi:hypothetical protein
LNAPALDFRPCRLRHGRAELKSPSAPAAERLLALKFLIHFVGDLHQPPHAADHQDRGGNCVSLSAPLGAQNNLHAYWDVAVVNALGHSAAQIADRLDARLSAAEVKDWTRGTPQSWAMDTFEIGRRDAYALPSTPTCQSGGSVALSPAYLSQAEKDAATQLLKAAVRMAAVLNGTLGAK